MTTIQRKMKYLYNMVVLKCLLFRGDYQMCVIGVLMWMMVANVLYLLIY